MDGRLQAPYASFKLPRRGHFFAARSAKKRSKLLVAQVPTAASGGLRGETQLRSRSLSRLVLDHSVRTEVGNESCIVLRNDFGPHGCYRPLARDGTGSQTFWWQDFAGHSAARRAGRNPRPFGKPLIPGREPPRHKSERLRRHAF